MAEIVSDRYKYDLNTDDAVREVLRLAQAFETQEKAAAQTATANNALGGQNKELARIERELNAILAQEAKTIEGANAKKRALLQISKNLTDTQKAQLKVSENLVKVEKEIGTATEKAAKSQLTFNDALSAGANRISGLVRSAAGLGAFLVTLEAASGKVQELDSFIQATQSSVAGLSRESATLVAGDILGISQAFTGVEQEKLLEVVRSAVVTFGEGATDVLNDVNVGLIRAIGEEGRAELLEQLSEYDTQLKGAGLNLQQSIEVINLGRSLGVFTDKAASSIKEAGLRLGAQGKDLIDALTNGFGEQFSTTLISDINKGLPSFEAFQRISEKVGKTDLNAKQYADLVAALGGGDLEDAGREFFVALSGISAASDTATTALTEFQKEQAKNIEIARQTARAQTQIADELSGASREYENATARVRLFITQGVLRLVQVLRELPGFIKENKTEIAGLGVAFATLKLGAFVSTVRTLTLAFKAQIVQARLLALANPYTAAIAGATALVSVISILTKEQSRAAQTAERVADSTKRLSREYGEEKRAVDALFKPLGDRNIKDEERKKLIDEIQNRYGDYLGNIDLEKAGAKELADAYDLVTEGILRSILAREQSRLQEEITQKIIDKTIELNNATDASASLGEKLGGVFGRVANAVTGVERFAESGGEALRANIANEIEELKTQFNEIPEVLKIAEQQLKDLDFGASVGASLSKTSTGAKAAVQSVAQDAKDTEKAVAPLTERLAALGVTIDSAFAKSVENAGSKGEALGLIIDNLAGQLGKLDKEVRDSATLENLPQVEAALAIIRKEAETLEFARSALNTGSRVAALDTLDAGEVRSVTDAPVELPVKVKLEKPDDDNFAEIFEAVTSGLEQAFEAGFDLLSSITEKQTAELDNLVSRQESIISEIEGNSEDYNARQLERERERLDTLEREQAQAAERARNIAQIEVAANAALAVAKAATQPFPANLIAITSTITALIAGFTRARTASVGAFAEGVDYLERPNGVPAGRDTIHIRADEGEMIISSSERKKLNDAGITSRYDVVRYAVQAAQRREFAVHEANRAGLQERDYVRRMEVLGIPLGAGSDKEQKRTNALLERIALRLERERMPHMRPVRGK